MEWQALFSSTILKCRLLQTYGGASVPINITRLNTYSNESKFSGIIPWHGWNILPLGNNDCLSVINGISLALWNIHFTLGPSYLFWHRKTNIHTWVQFKRQNVMTSFCYKTYFVCMIANSLNELHMIVTIFVCLILYVTVNNFLIMSRWVFLGWTST